MSRRKCNKCGDTKDLSEFHNNKKEVGGKHYTCKVCRSAQRKLTSKTPEGLIAKIYNSQLGSSRKRGHSLPEYSQEELKVWIKNNDKFEYLYNLWAASNYDKELTPSVDRLDDKIGYSFDNIRLVSWSDNKLAYYTNPVKKVHIPVDIYTLECIFVKSYKSVAEAAAEIGVTVPAVSNALNKKTRESGGFIVMPHGEKPTNKVVQQDYKFTKVKSVCPTSREVIKVYNSIKEAATDAQCKASSISRVLRKERSKTKGMGWEYA